MTTGILDRLDAVDFDAVLAEALGAAKTAALAIGGETWDLAREFAKEAAKSLKDRGVAVAKSLAAGRMTEDEARMLAEEDMILARMRLRAAAGLALIAAQKVIEAILGVLRGVFQRVLGFALF
ncbi:MAG: hypothetical protein AAF192_09505 [Pseudomonadota bacterium]